MRIGSWEVRRRAGVAVAVSLLAVGSWSHWRERTAVVPGPAPAQPEAFLHVGGSSDGNLLREQAIYSDPTPLFFPTPQNFGQDRVVAALQRQPGEGFRNFEPNYHFPEQKLAAYGLDAEAALTRPVEVLGRGDLAPFAGFGEVDREVAALAVRRGFLEIKSLMSGELIHAGTLAEVALPRSDFAPLEFLVAVVPGGLVGEPLLTVSSGSEQVDNFVRDYLVKTLRIGALLEPGKYAVSVGP